MFMFHGACIHPPCFGRIPRSAQMAPPGSASDFAPPQLCVHTRKRVMSVKFRGDDSALVYASLEWNLADTSPGCSGTEDPNFALVLKGLQIARHIRATHRSWFPHGGTHMAENRTRIPGPPFWHFSVLGWYICVCTVQH